MKNAIIFVLFFAQHSLAMQSLEFNDSDKQVIFKKPSRSGLYVNVKIIENDKSQVEKGYVFFQGNPTAIYDIHIPKRNLLLTCVTKGKKLFDQTELADQGKILLLDKFNKIANTTNITMHSNRWNLLTAIKDDEDLVKFITCPTSEFSGWLETNKMIHEKIGIAVSEVPYSAMGNWYETNGPYGKSRPYEQKVYAFITPDGEIIINAIDFCIGICTTESWSRSETFSFSPIKNNLSNIKEINITTHKDKDYMTVELLDNNEQALLRYNLRINAGENKDEITLERY